MIRRESPLTTWERNRRFHRDRRDRQRHVKLVAILRRAGRHLDHAHRRAA